MARKYDLAPLHDPERVTRLLRPLLFVSVLDQCISATQIPGNKPSSKLASRDVLTFDGWVGTVTRLKLTDSFLGETTTVLMKREWDGAQVSLLARRRGIAGRNEGEVTEVDFLSQPDRLRWKQTHNQGELQLVAYRSIHRLGYEPALAVVQAEDVDPVLAEDVLFSAARALVGANDEVTYAPPAPLLQVVTADFSPR